MDPRRRLDEKIDRLSRAEVPFVETYREMVPVEMPLGPPVMTEVIVIKVGKEKLKVYSFLILAIVIVPLTLRYIFN